MKTTAANQLAPSFYLLLVISLLVTIGLVGCGKKEEAADAQNKEKAVAETTESEELMTEPELITESPTQAPSESITEEIGEQTQEAIASLEQTTDTLLNDAAENIAEAEDALSEFMADSPSAAIAAEDETQIAEQEDLSEVVKPTPDLIRKVQQALANAGFDPGAADGISGPRTMSALKRFQNQNNLAEGQLTKETLQMLGVPY
ncbi:putative peptidoglycan binding protein [Nitrosomonas nitrosa]|uniref:peptidoglycan-binding protein n=1 Tax=Nitrosomonas nitrosa TaxID=52442 RepID=UPI000D32514E|nr:peptidoglycan-binding protein [Nitrosomonas nitrosa]MCO6433974.1 peptidoglycan-binding protein [Nitrosomonas nitrosa]PTR04730.1 putative peptidoglycan binding protein [Nitrosomonas nitrosa]